jgi:hypothetical protein
MRCPSCGTENAPDSRFCGGCGARFSGSAQRVAPTQKISDDASFPQRAGTAPAGQGAQLVTLPGTGRAAPPSRAYAASGPGLAQASGPPRPRAASSAPPGGHASAPATAGAPNGSARQAVPRPRTLPIDDPSMSMPMVARRPWGLIIVVLLIDTGLAIAGGWMLSEGLSSKPGRTGAAPRSGASVLPPSAVATTPGHAALPPGST